MSSESNQERASCGIGGCDGEHWPQDHNETMEGDRGPCPGCGFVPPYGTLAEWDHKYGEANCQVLAARAERIEALETEIAALRAELDTLKEHVIEQDRYREQVTMERDDAVKRAKSYLEQIRPLRDELEALRAERDDLRAALEGVADYLGHYIHGTTAFAPSVALDAIRAALNKEQKDA